jgi:hypothetical protein
MDFEGGERGSAMTWIGRHNSERKLRLSPLGAELAAETEAFFSGGYIKKLQSVGDPLPGWAWLNCLAHGELVDVQSLQTVAVAENDGQDGGEVSWESAQRVLASELLDLTDNDPVLLSRLQRRVLVPLELQMMRTEADRGLGAFELVQSSRAALRSSLS